MNDEKKTDLTDYLPEYLKSFQEIREIMRTETIELQKLREHHEQYADDRFPVTCGERGAARLEQMLGILPPPNDSLESRRFRILSRWNLAAPYHIAFLEQQLEMLCGKDGYRLYMDFAEGVLEVKVELISKHMLNSVKELLSAVVPCNIRIDAGLMYNQHGTLGKFTHRQLKEFTHKKLREDVMI
ncbi:hypothetical protein IMSAGC012_01221 [Lachnospiraceae bacterium]|nr:hypothetical protein IMSAGC012_01221 [Lachnospiraceae bacterium]